MKVLLFEDERLNAERLEELIIRYDPAIEILAVLESVKEGIAWFAGNQLPDLIFMDIRLADGLSFELFEYVNLEIPVIFTTAYDDYAIRAFKVNSVDYLVKPLDFSELRVAIDKFKKLRPVVSPSFIRKMLSENSRQYKSRFLIKVGEQLKHLETTDISYFHFEDRMVMAVTVRGGSLPVDYSLDQLEQLLNPAEFYRLNRKILACVSSIAKIHTYFNGRLKLELIPPVSEDVIISRQRVEGFKKWLGG